MNQKLKNISALAAFGFCLWSMAVAADYPSWWTARGVVSTNNPTTNDYAAANAGQVKWMATNAYLELEANLPGGAGTNVENLVGDFTSTNNYYLINIGQLKYVAEPFYDRLIAVGYTTTYPWTSGTSTDDVDYAVANIGQLKYMFNFDLTCDGDNDGLADWVETETGTYVNESDTGTDPADSDSDDDGIDDGTEVLTLNTDPNNSDTNKPTVTFLLPTNNCRWVWIP